MSQAGVNWKRVPLRNLGRWTGGGTPSKANPSFWRGTTPWVSPKDMKQLLITDAEDHITEAAVKASSAKVVPENSILIVTRSGILSHTLPVAKTTRPVAINQDLKAAVLADEYEPDFILHAMRAHQSSILEGCRKSGTTVANLDTDRLLDFEISVPSKEEQRRIVAKLHGSLARIKAAHEELDRVPKLVERYKQAVLASAFQNTRYTYIQAAELFGWSSGKSLTKKNHKPGPYPVYGGNGVNGFHASFLCEGATLVIGRVGAQCGNVSVTSGPAWITDNAIFAAHVSEAISIEFARLVFQQANLNEVAAGSGQPFVNQTILNTVMFPKISNEEQNKIIVHVHSAREVIERAFMEIDVVKNLLPRLEAALLAKTFRCKLMGNSAQPPQADPLKFID